MKIGRDRLIKILEGSDDRIDLLDLRYLLQLLEKVLASEKDIRENRTFVHSYVLKEAGRWYVK